MHLEDRAHKSKIQLQTCRSALRTILYHRVSKSLKRNKLPNELSRILTLTEIQGETKD